MKTIGRKTVKGDKTSAPKAVKAGGSKKTDTTASAAKAPPSHEEIARRAYELYLERGGEHGHDAQDWAQAESELGA
ncbi:MAG TPA: DUF2934 domain-containing protein [Polyangia bacterium]|nr:DUF2934 domain-containing protein [Polyangia bacterium]